MASGIWRETTTRDAGSADVRLMLHRRLTLVARYGIYRYVFDDAVALPLDWASTSLRQTVRVGLTGPLPSLIR